VVLTHIFQPPWAIDLHQQHPRLCVRWEQISRSSRRSVPFLRRRVWAGTALPSRRVCGGQAHLEPTQYGGRTMQRIMLNWGVAEVAQAGLGQASQERGHLSSLFAPSKALLLAQTVSLGPYRREKVIYNMMAAGCTCWKILSS
jgi:hypothetical protein